MIQRWLPAAAIAALLGSCGDEAPEAKAKRGEEWASAQAAAPPEISLVPIAPGPDAPVNEVNEVRRKTIEDPDQVAAGKQLYQAYNCVGCHFNGGGGMGPPLMDETWIYGSSPEHIVAAIREGRPAGMPSYRAMTTEEQRLQLAAYVKSLSAGAEKTE